MTCAVSSRTGFEEEEAEHDRHLVERERVRFALQVQVHHEDLAQREEHGEDQPRDVERRPDRHLVLDDPEPEGEAPEPSATQQRTMPTAPMARGSTGGRSGSTAGMGVGEVCMAVRGARVSSDANRPALRAGGPVCDVSRVARRRLRPGLPRYAPVGRARALPAWRREACERDQLQPSPDQVEPDHVEPDQVEPDQVEPDHVLPRQVEPDHVDPAQVRPSHRSPLQVRPDQLSTRLQVRPSHSDAEPGAAVPGVAEDVDLALQDAASPSTRWKLPRLASSEPRPVAAARRAAPTDLAGEEVGDLVDSPP